MNLCALQVLATAQTVMAGRGCSRDDLVDTSIRLMAEVPADSSKIKAVLSFLRVVQVPEESEKKAVFYNKMLRVRLDVGIDFKRCILRNPTTM